MPTPPRTPPTQHPETLKVTPITAAPSAKKRGRPKKRDLPPMPAFDMSDFEHTWFDWFVESHRSENPDLTDTDQIHLLLAAVEFIKYLRVVQNELETGQVISMARQHPGVQMRAELDLLSVTRKARMSGKQQEDPAVARAREALLGLSS